MPMFMCPCGTSPLRPTGSFTDRFSPPTWLFGMREAECSRVRVPTSLGASSLRFIRRWAIAGEKNKKVAYENLLWALLNTKEFQFNQ